MIMKEQLDNFCCAQLKVVVVIYFIYTLCIYLIFLTVCGFVDRTDVKEDRGGRDSPLSSREYMLQYYKL